MTRALRDALDGALLTFAFVAVPMLAGSGIAAALLSLTAP